MAKPLRTENERTPLFYVSNSDHSEGEIIEIRSFLPAVRWAKKDAADLYNMGLMVIV